MRALHSSSALAANLFDYWTERDKSPLLAALGVDAKGETSLDFEARFPTGLGGTPPHFDMAMRRSTGFVVAVEAKFEALHRVMDSFSTGRGINPEEWTYRCPAATPGWQIQRCYVL